MATYKLGLEAEIKTSGLKFKRNVFRIFNFYQRYFGLLRKISFLYNFETMDRES